MVKVRVLQRSFDSHLLYIFLWSLYILFFPFRLFSSGNPQIADIFFILLFLLILAREELYLDERLVACLKSLGLFVLCTILVNGYWAFRLSDPVMIFPSLYYFYDMLIFATFLFLCRKTDGKILLYTTWVIGISSVLPVLHIAGSFIMDTPVRNSVFFQNQSQFGYWALLSATIVFMTGLQEKISPVFKTTVYLCLGICAYFSSSRAAMAGMIILGCVMAWRFCSKDKRLTKLFWSSCLLIVMMAGSWVASDAAFRQYLSGRILKQDRTITTLLERRYYDRLWLEPEYLILGAGEGAYGRFQYDAPEADEVHSAIGTVAFSYGIPGVVLFVVFLGLIIKYSQSFSVLSLFGVFFYNLLHQGLRFSLLWVALACCLCMAFDFGRDRPVFSLRRFKPAEI